MNKAEKEALLGLPIALLIALGLAWAGSQYSHILAGQALYTWCIALAFIVQWLAFIPAYLKQTEKYYDLIGSLTYLSLLALGLLNTPNLSLRSQIIAGLISIWAIRLGSFLFLRIRSTGHDGRFDELKPSFLRFLLTWTLQGLWVSFSMAAGLAAITSQYQLPWDSFASFGLGVWLIGFGIEALADRQKRRFRQNPANKGTFITHGLWAWSRHPNYFGEIVLWIGIALMALPVLQGWQYLTLISPVFITILLTKISGIPLLEERADKKWGGQSDYETYKAQTPVLLLKPPKQ